MDMFGLTGPFFSGEDKVLGFKVGGGGWEESKVDCFNSKGTFSSVLTFNNFSYALSQEK